MVRYYTNEIIKVGDKIKIKFPQIGRILRRGWHDAQLINFEEKANGIHLTLSIPTLFPAQGGRIYIPFNNAGKVSGSYVRRR